MRARARIQNFLGECIKKIGHGHAHGHGHGHDFVLIRLESEPWRNGSTALHDDDAVAYEDARTIILTEAVFIDQLCAFTDKDVFVDDGTLDGAVFFND